MKKRINERIKEIRKYFKMNQDEFAAKLSFSKRALQNYENNIRQIPIKFLTAIYNEFNINPIWVLTGEKNMFDNKYNEQIGKKQINEYYHNEHSSDIKTNDDKRDSLYVEKLLNSARRVLFNCDKETFEILEKNILYFDHNIKIENNINNNKIENKVEKLETELRNVTQKLENLLKNKDNDDIDVITYESEVDEIIFE